MNLTKNLSSEEPLLALLQTPPHEIPLDQLEDQIRFLRTQSINQHVLTQGIEKNALGNSKGKTRKLSNQAKENLLADLI